MNRSLLAVALLSTGATVSAQQYNSDSWISKPEGTITIIPTIGQRNTMLMTTFSLIRKFEFTVAAYMYNNDLDPTTDDGYSSTFYAKYMFYENAVRTGGAAVKAGTGLFPGLANEEQQVKDALRTYWINAPVTIPLFNNKLSLDLMPGMSTTFNYGENDITASSFTYSTRAAWYCFGPELAVVGEVFGAAGQAPSIPEFKIGPRWEPDQYITFALTYGEEFNGDNGAGFEFGIMIFTPPFLCLGGCK